MLIALISVGALISTLLGGFFALRYKNHLHLILGYSAGAVLGVAFFDLLPESIDIAGNYVPTSVTTSTVALGFVIFYFLSNWFIFSNHDEEEECRNEHHHGTLGAGGLVLHSFLDGVVIGLSFKVSNAVGLVVTLAVLAHDFSDGINTVGLVLRAKKDRAKAINWLVADAVAPVFGIIFAHFFNIPDRVFGLVLAVFCGFFLYIGASDLLPESHHHQHPSVWTTVLTLLGVLTIYGVVSIAG